MLSDIWQFIKNFVLIIGPKEAGKTSILRRMITGDFEETQPTYGLHEELIKKIRVIEIGGQANYQPQWQKALEQRPVHIFFVVDITRPADLVQYQEFVKLQGKKTSDLQEKITLCANKSDLTAQIPETITEIPAKIICSAKKGTGILDVVELIATFGHQEELSPLENIQEPEPGKGQDKLAKINALKKEYEGKF